MAVEKGRIKGWGKKTHWGFARWARSDADSVEEPIIEGRFFNCIDGDRFRRRPLRRLFPEAAVTKDFFNHIGLAFLDEVDDPHCLPALWTFQRVHFVNRLG